jgi:uncharacterized protein YfcZ (UPF0381/DUF406 family)
MATHTVTTLVDDIDGSTDDVVTCAFGLGDSHFEIDLNLAHREELEAVLGKFVEAAREVESSGPGHGRRRRKQASAGVKRDTQAIRQWASENGIEVSGRGRLPASVIEAYEAAQ